MVMGDKVLQHLLKDCLMETIWGLKDKGLVGMMLSGKVCLKEGTVNWCENELGFER